MALFFFFFFFFGKKEMEDASAPSSRYCRIEKETLPTTSTSTRRSIMRRQRKRERGKKTRTHRSADNPAITKDAPHGVVTWDVTSSAWADTNERSPRARKQV